MTNQQFYAYCRDQRKVEPDPQKREALQDVYGYLRECGVSRQGVRQYIERRVYQEADNGPKIAALHWVWGQFAGRTAKETPEGQQALL